MSKQKNTPILSDIVAVIGKVLVKNNLIDQCGSGELDLSGVLKELEIAFDEKLDLDDLAWALDKNGATEIYGTQIDKSL